MIPGGTLGLVLGRALLRAGQVTVPDERGVAEVDLDLAGLGLELDEAVLLEVLVALLLLLRGVVRLVGGEAALLVAVLAVDLVVVLGPLHHHHLVDAALARRSDGPDVQRHVAADALPAAAVVEPNVKEALELLTQFSDRTGAKILGIHEGYNLNHKSNQTRSSS